MARSLLRILLSCSGLLGLSGCLSIPPAIAITGYLIDAGSYAATGKGPSDHLLSALTGKDCAVLRLVTEANHEICSDPGSVGLTEIQMIGIPPGAIVAPGVTGKPGDIVWTGRSGAWTAQSMRVKPLSDMPKGDGSATPPNVLPLAAMPRGPEAPGGADLPLIRTGEHGGAGSAAQILPLAALPKDAAAAPAAVFAAGNGPTDQPAR